VPEKLQTNCRHRPGFDPMSQVKGMFEAHGRKKLTVISKTAKYKKS